MEMMPRLRQLFLHSMLTFGVRDATGLLAPTTRTARAPQLMAIKLHGSQGSRSPLTNWYLEELGLVTMLCAYTDPTVCSKN